MFEFRLKLFVHEVYWNWKTDRNDDDNEWLKFKVLHEIKIGILMKIDCLQIVDSHELLHEK